MICILIFQKKYWKLKEKKQILTSTKSFQNLIKLIMQILIAGGGGSVGQDLAVLLSKKNKIISLHRSKMKKKIKNKNIKWKMMDLKKKIYLNEKPDIIINCVAAHKFSKKNRTIDYICSNITVVKNLIDFAIRKNVKKIINLSTVSVYENTNSKILDEESQINYNDILAITKHSGEKLLENQPVDYINLRLPAILSSNLNVKRSWISFLISDIKKNKKVEIFNSNAQFNNVIDTEEIARFIEKVKDKKENIRDTFNLCASKSIKLILLFYYIKKFFSSKSKIKIKKSKKILPYFKVQKIEKKFKFSLPSVISIIRQNLEKYNNKYNFYAK